MLKDAKVRALAVEFGGNWLDFRRFEEFNTVDRERFSTFTNELREAMFEEPVAISRRCVSEQSLGARLPVRESHICESRAGEALRHARFLSGGANDWVRIDDADQYGRGGLLPMAAFLTKNAPGLRTSPVKRGYWVVKNVLGEHIPPPPAVVPELPRDEAKLDLPLREKLAAASRRSVAAPHVIRVLIRWAWSSKDTARSATDEKLIWPAMQSIRTRPSPAAAKGTASTACGNICASTGNRILSTICAASCWPTG